jgi:hypothetical protein
VVQVMSSWIGLTGLIAVIVLSVLSVVCVLLVWIWRRLAALQTQLDSLSSGINSLEIAHQGLLVRFMNLPRSRRAQSSSLWSDTLEDQMTLPAQPDEENSRGTALYTTAPKTSPE